MPDLCIAADDRSGAIETAGAVADAIGRSVPVLPWSDRPMDIAESSVAGFSVSVVDLGSRHLRPEEAAQRAGTVDHPGLGAAAAIRAHKMDSTLRGNWSYEVLARRGPGQRVVVIPALPALGRTCVGGRVLVHGVAVHQTASAVDGASVITTERPVEMIEAASGGTVAVAGLQDPSELVAWLRTRGTVVVCDAVTDADLDLLASGIFDAATEPGGAWPVVVGSSAALAALSRVVARATATVALPPVALPSGSGGIVMVCGSRHPVARRQVAALPWRSDVEVLVAPDVPGDGQQISQELALRARAHLDRRPEAVLVVIGGDTAAAVLGEQTVHVHATLAPGTAWGRMASGRAVVVRSGGFGDAGSLARLVYDTLAQ